MNDSSPSPARRSFAVIPAAGRSVRMGRPKLLLPWDAADGRTLVEQVLAAWRDGGVTHRIVTVHPDDRQLAAVCRAAGAEVVVPANPPPDMKASVAAALAFIAERYRPHADDVCLIAPADLPHLAASVVQQLLAASIAEQAAALRPVHQGKNGHPFLLPWSLIVEIASIPANRGLDELLDRVPVVDVQCGPACLAADVDTPDDYRRLRDPHDRRDPS